MTRSEVYEGVRGTMSLYGGLFKIVIEKLGFEEALSIHGRLQEPIGDGWAKLLKEKLGGNKLSMDIFSELYISMSTSGVENVYEVNLDTFKVKGYQCPIYDGLKDAGLSHEVINQMCTRAGKLIIQSLIKNYPEISAGIDFRNKPEEYCVEWYKLKK